MYLHRFGPSKITIKLIKKNTMSAVCVLLVGGLEGASFLHCYYIFHSYHFNANELLLWALWCRHQTSVQWFVYVVVSVFINQTIQLFPPLPLLWTSSFFFSNSQTASRTNNHPIFIGQTISVCMVYHWHKHPCRPPATHPLTALKKRIVCGV